MKKVLWFALGLVIGTAVFVLVLLSAPATEAEVLHAASRMTRIGRDSLFEYYRANQSLPLGPNGSVEMGDEELRRWIREEASKPSTGIKGPLVDPFLHASDAERAVVLDPKREQRIPVSGGHLSAYVVQGKWLVVASIGPDRQRDFRPGEALTEADMLTMAWDPTNGIASNGDILFLADLSGANH